MYNVILFCVTIIPGKYDEALVYYQEAFDASRSILGITHPQTLVYISNLGSVLEAQGPLLLFFFYMLFIVIFIFNKYYNRKVRRGLSLLSRGFGW